MIGTDLLLLIMETILEYEPSEILRVKETLRESGAFFKENAAALFEDCFLALTSSQAKTENFKLMKTLTDTEDGKNELYIVFNTVLNICAQVIKVNVRGLEEF